MSDHGTPLPGTGSSPSGPTPTGSAGKAATIPRAKKKPSPELLMAEYIAAYVAANRKHPNFRLVYVAGWIQFRSRRSSMVIDRKRPSAIATMTKRLRDQAAAQGIEARSDGTQSGPAEGESPVGSADALDPIRFFRGLRKTEETGDAP